MTQQKLFAISRISSFFCLQMGNNNNVLESRMLIKMFLLAILWNVYFEMKITHKKGHMNIYGTTYHI